DLVFEACGGPAPIAMGCPTVMIGDSCGGPASGAGSAENAEVVENAAGARAGGAAAHAGNGFETIEKLPSSIAKPVSASPVVYPSVLQPDAKRKIGDIQKEVLVKGSHEKSGRGHEAGTVKGQTTGEALPPKGASPRTPIKK
ncbi:MAG: hypothetical protein ACM369_14460, partial [Acidobacteriota bacterium]